MALRWGLEFICGGSSTKIPLLTELCPPDLEKTKAVMTRHGINVTSQKVFPPSPSPQRV
jgi:hypothetical protein